MFGAVVNSTAAMISARIGMMIIHRAGPGA